MKLLLFFWRKFHPSSPTPPYYFDYSLMKIIIKPIRKYINVVIIPNIVFNNIRIILYRFCGFKIGRNVFIGMKCYLDDLCYDKILIEDNVTISYGVFFACHGKNQSHTPIVIKRGAYIGMRASIISTKHGICLGENSVVGACALVNKDIPDNAMAVGIPIRIIQK